MVLEHRWLAGGDFRGEINGNDLRNKFGRDDHPTGTRELVMPL